MTVDEARQQIQTTIDQFGQQAGAPLDLIIEEIRASLGHRTANALIDEFDLELRYHITPTTPEGSGD